MRYLAAVVLLLLVSCGQDPGRVAPGVTFLPGAVNGVLVEQDGRRILIYGDPSGELGPVDDLLLTHHRRDALAYAHEPARTAGQVFAPGAERELFTAPGSYWEEYRTARFHDYAQQSSKVLTEPLRVDRFVSGSSGAPEGFEALDTPGYTRGAVTYLFEAGGKRIAAVGDLIYGDGQILDIYSLQDAIPEADTRGYHGYAARAASVIESLNAIRERRPDILIPAHGPVIENPEQAIGKLIARLQELFRLYYTTDALRWYWGDDNLNIRARRVLSDAAIEWMPMARELREIPPRWMHKFNTSRLIVSDDGPAFLIDCGTDRVMEQIQDLQDRKVFTKIEGIFVTHFHDDHTDRVQAMAEKCDCPVYSGPEVVDILERPGAYRMPAQSHLPINNVEVLEQGEELQFHEYTFTYTYFPGQAVYHGGLKLEREDGEKFFFVGDSFSPSGLDDYCLLNRHFLHPGLGHLRCLDEIERADPEYWLVNQHIEPVFRYSIDQLKLMREVVEGKRRVAAELVPFEDPNFGTDEQWARLYPYGQQPGPTGEVELWAVVFNHAPEERTFQITLHPPDGWEGETVIELTVASLAEGRASVKLTAPADASALTVIPADMGWGDRLLPLWLEAIIERP